MEEKKNNNSYYTALYARIKQVQVPEFDNIWKSKSLTGQ